MTSVRILIILIVGCLSAKYARSKSHYGEKTMNAKEISEIKKRFRVDKSNITRIRGCYINEKKEIISRFDQSVALMSAEETEEIFAILKKTLSGTVGKNLLDISFTNNQVLDSDEHRLLSALKNSSLSDDEAVEQIIGIIKDSLVIEGNYMILLAADTYDVPSYSSDGAKKEGSQSVYSYILCSICPVKMTRAALGYYLPENRFRNVTPDWVISAPEMGFLFPAFDGRTSNIYNTLYYTRSASDNHGELIESLFKTAVPMPAAEQKDSFGTILRDTVSDECSYDVVCSVRDKMSEMIEEHKASRDPDPLVISKSTVSDVLRSCDVAEEKIEEFAGRFDETFGSHAELAPYNIIDTKQLEVRTPQVVIKLSPEASGLLETRMIDGQKCIIIRAEGTVEVNGVEISISEDKK